MSARRYTLGLLLFSTVLLALVAGINRLVDPFWYYRDLEIAGFNALKPRFARFERHVKPQILAREQPQAIVLGSSFSEIGFDTNDAMLTDGGKLKAYNFAFAGADWMMVQCHFAYARSVTALRRVVVGVHPGPLPMADCGDGLPEVRDFSRSALLFSLQALNESLRTVLEQGRGRSSHTREGRYFYAGDAAGIGARFRENFLGQARKYPRCTLDNVPAVPPASRDVAPARVPVAEDLDLSGLREMIRAARASGIHLKLVAYPRHALLLELDFLCREGVSYWGALAAMAQVVAEEAPDGNAQLWSFYGYNEITGESVASTRPVYWQDPEHFTHEMGALMLGDLYGPAVRGKIGYRIAVGGAGEAYRAFLEERDRYIAAHPRFYDELRTVLAPLR